LSNKPLQPGDRVGNYILREVIGEGAFAQVWKAAHHERPGRVVAVKIATDDAFRRQLSREGRLPDIKHPNVVPILDADTRFAEHPYVVMPFYAGGSLADLIAQHPRGLPEDRVTALLQDIASGLGAAHEQDVVHRDIKPANILIDDGGRALIADFGLSLSDGVSDARHSMIQSTSLSRETTGAMAGTLPYLAPEVLQGNPGTKASDVYSLGVLLFEMLTGRLPGGLELPSQVRAYLRRAEEFDALMYWACRPVGERFPDGEAMRRAVEDGPNPLPWGFRRSEIPSVVTISGTPARAAMVKATRWISLAWPIVLNLIRPRAGAITMGVFLTILLVVVIRPEDGKPDKTGSSIAARAPLETESLMGRVTTKTITLRPGEPPKKIWVPPNQKGVTRRARHRKWLQIRKL
jgi:serine/threonine protein kinase